MKTSEVITRIKTAASLKTEHKHANCAICYQKGYKIVAIYAPRGDSIPLCTKHFEEVEQVIQDRLAELKKR